VVVFDEYFNLADPSLELFEMTFVTSRDHVLFQDVAVSYRIIELVAVHSIYFYSSSPGLLLKIFHNNTQIPTSNFIRRNMQVEDLTTFLKISGFTALFDSFSPSENGSTAVNIRQDSQLNYSEASKVNQSDQVET
jgi:hypothetical protein